MTARPPAVPTIVTHYRAYLQAKTKLIAEVSVGERESTLAISPGDRNLTLVFMRRKQKWCLHSIAVRRDEKTTSFTKGELARAIAALLGHEPAIPTKSAISGASGPRTNAALRERQNTVIRV